MNTVDLPEKVRAFVAIHPPAEVLRSLESAQQQLQTKVSREAVRWTYPEQIHLTLQFLGYIKRDLVGAFETALERSSREVSGFHLKAQSVGCFPNNKRPKIIWAGLTGELEPLHTLKEKLDLAFSELGYAPEVRKFHAHLTLGRVAELKSVQACRIAHEISLFQLAMFGEWEVREIYLMQSVLSSEGASHRVLNSFKLK